MAKVPGDLYVKYDPTDNGTDVIPPGAAFWASPSIQLVDDAGASLPYATVGVSCRIMVTVDSTSDQARSGVRVQTWVCDYTPGYIGPDSARPSSGGPSGRAGSVATAVKAGSFGVAAIPWTPDKTDLINSPTPADEEGHVCVGANVFAELPPPPEGAFLSAGTLDVINNRHHGWKNITVKKAPGGLPNLIPFRLTNPGPEPADFVVQAQELDPDVAMGPLTQEHLLMTRCITLAGGEPEPELVPPGCWREPHERTWLAGGGKLALRGMPETTPLRPAERPSEFELVTAESRDRAVRVPIRPGEHVPVVLRMPNDGAPGEVRAFDVAQQDGDGNVLGGGRLIVVHVPEWFC